MRLFKGQLTLFQRGMGYEGPQSHYVIAAWHWRKSITWRWLVWWWPRFSFKRPFGVFFFSKQENMFKK